MPTKLVTVIFGGSKLFTQWNGQIYSTPFSSFGRHLPPASLTVAAGFAFQMTCLPGTTHTTLTPENQINRKENITSLVPTGKLLGEKKSGYCLMGYLAPVDSEKQFPGYSSSSALFPNQAFYLSNELICFKDLTFSFLLFLISNVPCISESVFASWMCTDSWWNNFVIGLVEGLTSLNREKDVCPVCANRIWSLFPEACCTTLYCNCSLCPPTEYSPQCFLHDQTKKR